MTADYEKLRQEEAEKSAKLQELMSVPTFNISNPQTNPKADFGQLRRTGATHCRRPSLAAAVPLEEPSHQAPPTSNRDRNEADNLRRLSKLTKLHKNLLNRKSKAGGGVLSPAATSYGQLIEDLEEQERLDALDGGRHDSSVAKGKSLMASLASTIPLALPTLQLHLLLSLTMVLLTHRCPQYLIIL